MPICSVNYSNLKTVVATNSSSVTDDQSPTLNAPDVEPAITSTQEETTTIPIVNMSNDAILATNGITLSVNLPVASEDTYSVNSPVASEDTYSVNLPVASEDTYSVNLPVASEDTYSVNPPPVTTEAAPVVDTPPVTTEAAPVVVNTPVTTDAPPVVDTPPVTTDAAPVVVNTPPVTTDAAPVVVNTPVTTDAAPVVVNTPVTTDAPPVVDTPPVTTDAAPVVVNTPPVTTDAAPVVVNTPVTTDAAPVVVNTPTVPNVNDIWFYEPNTTSWGRMKLSSTAPNYQQVLQKYDANKDGKVIIDTSSPTATSYYAEIANVGLTLIPETNTVREFSIDNDPLRNPMLRYHNNTIVDENYNVVNFSGVNPSLFPQYLPSPPPLSAIDTITDFYSGPIVNNNNKSVAPKLSN
jgi:hypothetical protein